MNTLCSSDLPSDALQPPSLGHSEGRPSASVSLLRLLLANFVLRGSRGCQPVLAVTEGHSQPQTEGRTSSQATALAGVPASRHPAEPGAIYIGAVTTYMCLVQMCILLHSAGDAFAVDRAVSHIKRTPKHGSGWRTAHNVSVCDEGPDATRCNQLTTN